MNLGSVLLLVCLALTPSAVRAQADSSSLRIHFLDVGQGDAILIQYRHQAVLIDAGRGDRIIEALRDYGVDSLLAAVVSHNHDDHLGGMDAVIADFSIGRYLSNGRPPENQNAAAMECWLKERRVARPPPPWEPIRLGDATITVFTTALDNPDENNASLGVLIERGAFRALLTGDSQVEELNGWMDRGMKLDVDVLKAAHHGARNGVSPGWLDRTRPDVVVISVGAGNSYGHPDPAAMRYYQAHGRKIYRTDTDGTVTVAVDAAGGYTITTAGPIAR